MIEDLDGATVEPTRRGHVIVLSVATAALALAVLVALVVPPSAGSVAEAPSAAPSVSDAPKMTLVSGGAGFRPGSVRVTFDQLRPPAGGLLVCAAPRPDLWGPTFMLGGVSYAVGDGTGRALPPPAAVVIPLTVQVYDGSGQQLLYTCTLPEAFAPRIDLSNIAP